MKKRSHWLLFGGLILLALVAASFLGVGSSDERTSQCPSSYSALPHGTRAAFMTLERAGYKPRRWRQDWGKLTREKGVMFFAPADPFNAAGQHRPLSASAARAAAQWVANGNTLLYFLSAPEREKGYSVLTEELGLALTFEALPADHQRTQTLRQFLPSRLERDFDHILPVPWAVEVRRVTAESVPGFIADKGQVVVMSDAMGAGHGHLALVPHGNGRVYLFSSPGFIDNHFIGRSDNLTLLLNLLDRELGPNRSLLFDEYHHGFSSEFSAMNFTQLPVVRFAALQAGILALLFLGTSWLRFGRPVPLVRDTRRSIREYTQSLGNLYYRARAHRDTLDYLFGELRRSLCSRYNLPDTAPADWIGAKLRVQRGAAEAWHEITRDCERLQNRRRIANGDLLAVSRKIEEFRKLVA